MESLCQPGPQTCVRFDEPRGRWSGGSVLTNERSRLQWACTPVFLAVHSWPETKSIRRMCGAWSSSFEPEFSTTA